jgi:multidrug resistance efflux pump
MEAIMKNKYSLWASALIFVSILLTGCSQISAGAGDKPEMIEASGVIEARQVNIAPEFAGRIAEVIPEEGSQVSAGDVVLRLEDDLIISQLGQAQAGVDAAEAQLENARAAELASEANLRAAEAALEGAEISYQGALAQVQQREGDDRVADWNDVLYNEFDQPTWYFQQSEQITAAENLVEETRDTYLQELDNYQETASEVADGQFLTAENRLADAQAAYQIAQELNDHQVSYQGREEILDLIEIITDAAENELEEAQTSFDQLLTDSEYDEILQARARVTVAREHYDLARDLLFDQYTGEHSFEVQAASALLDQAIAGKALAQAQQNQAEKGRISAESAVRQAQASLESINLQLAKLELTAPISGVVVTRTVEPGEVISAGYTALTIADLDQLTVTVYLPEDRYGQVALGDTAELRIDSYPEESFEAEVIWIADQAEYTPRNVQTQEERQNTVYAVKLAVQASSKLKPGMPADVTFIP